MVKENKYIKTYHNFNVETILINGYSIRVRKSPRFKKQNYPVDKKTFSKRFKKQIQNYHAHHYNRTGDKSFFCTKCNNLKCCNLCPDCNSKIYSNSKDFDSDDDLKIDSDLDSNNSKDENSSSSNIIYPIYSYLFNKK